MKSDYNERYYELIERGSSESARFLIPEVMRLFAVRSVLDVGCGDGAWLAAWKRHGAVVQGIDANMIAPDHLKIDANEYLQMDLGHPIALERRFDLVQCLEVAEHLCEEAGRKLAPFLCRHGDIILFSAAAPGQGGEHHVNERPYGYWRDIFLDQGYAMVDALRPRICGDRRIAPWYRYNCFLFVRLETLDDYPDLCKQQIPSNSSPPDISPPIYRLRKAIMRLLPTPWVTSLARGAKVIAHLTRRSIG